METRLPPNDQVTAAGPRRVRAVAWLSSPGVQFGLLLVFYAAIVVAFSRSALWGDEGRYLDYTRELIQGLESGRIPRPMLHNGPGYPLFLLPFVWLGAPLLVPRLFNALFLALAVFFFRRTLARYTTPGRAAVWSYALGLYWPMYTTLPLLLTEPQSLFLVTLFGDLFCLARTRPRRTTVVLAAVVLAWLAMTKVIFGYVIFVGLALFLAGKLAVRWVGKGRPRWATVAVLALAAVLCLPYLGWTRYLTGRTFYWSSLPGSLFYCLTTPYPAEYGDWFATAGAGSPFFRHRALFEKLRGRSDVQADEALFRQGLTNLRDHPRKFALNWLANLGRLLFNYPFSYTPQKPSTYFYLLPNMFLVVFLVLCLIPMVRHWRRCPPEVRELALVILIYVGGLTLVSALPRFLVLALPLMLLLIEITLTRVIRISLRGPDPAPGAAS
jgi:hypothetical protein